MAETVPGIASDRETELARVLPLHVVTEFCGNTAVVAQKHYLMLSDEDFKAATQLSSVKPNSAARNPARYTSELAGTGSHETKKPREIPLNSAGFQPVPVNGCPVLDSNQEPTD